MAGPSDKAIREMTEALAARHPEKAAELFAKLEDELERRRMKRRLRNLARKCSDFMREELGL